MAKPASTTSAASCVPSVPCPSSRNESKGDAAALARRPDTRRPDSRRDAHTSVAVRVLTALLVHGVQQGIDIFESLLGGQRFVEQSPRFGIRVPQLRQQQVGVFHHVVFDLVWSVSSRAAIKANLHILRRSLAMIRSAMAGPTPGSADRPLAS